MERSVSFTASAAGTASTSIDIADISNANWTIRFWSQAAVASDVTFGLQESIDNFSSVRTIGVLSEAGVGTRSERTFRWYELPNARVGIASAKIRLFVQSLDGGPVSCKLAIDF